MAMAGCNPPYELGIDLGNRFGDLRDRFVDLGNRFLDPRDRFVGLDNHFLDLRTA
ncbi:hypothetical protein ACFQZQ_08340 [Lysobacter koreensis]|uniref:Uncharacterized protein n=1 Tax=Lysobacter koreensis TaxID=266122 RepID=A0ABW2YNS3_9GAMM